MFLSIRSLFSHPPRLSVGSQSTGGKPLLLSCALTAILTLAPAQADRLRVSPDDLRLRVAVSEQLSAPLRLELREMARSTPLPVTDGVLQTQTLLSERFAERGWDEEQRVLARYYFLMARLEQSQDFSDEFIRRRANLVEGIRLLSDYHRELQRLAPGAVTQTGKYVEPEVVSDFPLLSAERSEEGEVTVLHRLPKPSTALGRENIRRLILLADQDRERLEDRLDKLDAAEERFLDEASLLGRELIEMRADVRQWVRVPGEGLPFSF